MTFDVEFYVNNRNFKAEFGKVIQVGGDTEAAYNEGYEAGQKSVIDESKIIEATASGLKSVTLNDVSEIKHKITVELYAMSETGGIDVTLTITDDTKTATYTLPPDCKIEVASSSPNMKFDVNYESIKITVNYQKSWGIQKGREQIFERIQDGGKSQNYYYAFAYDRFDDSNFFPVYPIECSNGTTPGRYIFFNATGITDTKVEVVANSNNIESAFNGATNLVNIRKLTVYESTTFTNTFAFCSALEEIRFGGTIGQDINFRYCAKLSDESIDSIIEHLKDLTGATAKTLTVHTTVYNKIVSSGKDALITAKNWSLAKA